MKLKDMLVTALEGVWTNKMRSSLTMLGIIIGVLSVIIIVTLGQSLKQQTMAEVEVLGVNSFTLVGMTNDDQKSGELTINELDLLQNTIEGIDFIVPMQALYSQTVVATAHNKAYPMLIGVTPDYLKISSAGLNKGRFFTETENRMGRRVIVIGQNTADELFGPRMDPLGKTVRVNGKTFTVCGVAKPEAQMMGMSMEYCYTPIKTIIALNDNDDEIAQALVRVKEEAPLEQVMDRTIRFLERRQGAKDIFAAQTNEQLMEQINMIVGGITGVFGALAGIALLVGGIGIMNIMLVSVTERTREIGVRIAVGARRRDIMLQFLVESAVISSLGGCIGMAFGIGVSALIAMALNMPVVISPGIIAIAFLFSAAIGIAFGIYPAGRAAALDPIESLRYE